MCYVPQHPISSGTKTRTARQQLSSLFTIKCIQSTIIDPSNNSCMMHAAIFILGHSMLFHNVKNQTVE